ncbi:uncharacterized protein EAF01_003450 [Botrytis porri]|uniref:uncharacterized protein n=1 Tax=Botrytis porri TaxID=87229 RepID=UPI00190169C1|nr:uncharacterized protein EAF01_003450 [Botrytis porri]KAF7909732.1 hypothetical protein EAF01_003450 [Botrytis porri]
MKTLRHPPLVKQQRLKVILKPSKLAQSASKKSEAIVLLSRIGIADVDPISRLRLGEGSDVQKLLHYCKLFSFASLMKRLFMPIGVNDNKRRLLDNGITYGSRDCRNKFSSSRIAIFKRIRYPPYSPTSCPTEPGIARKHNTEGLRVGNKRLNDPVQALSDRSTGSVASFTSHGVVRVDYFLDSLKTLLALITAITSSFGLDLCRDDIQVSRPMYTRYSRYDEHLTETNTNTLRYSTTKYEITKMYSRNALCTDFIRMVDSLDKATETIKEAAPKIESAKQWSNFSSGIRSSFTGMNWLSPDNSSPRPLDPLGTSIHNVPQQQGQFPRACKHALLDTTRVILRGERFPVERHCRACHIANAMIEIVKSTLATYLGTDHRELEASLSSSTMIFCKADIHEKIHLSSSAEWREVSF